MRKRFLVVHNPVAGMHRRWMLRSVCRILRERGAALTIVRANTLETDVRLAKDGVRTGEFDAVVAAGGDSTVRGIASGLNGSSVPLGVIPLGTGNVLAHEIGIRRGPREVAKCIMAGPTARISSATANDEAFYLMASAGFDACVLARLNVIWKRRVGKFAYFGPAIRQLSEPVRIFNARIDGIDYRCSWLIVARARHYAGPFTIVPNQNLLAPGFHAVIVRAETRRDVVRTILGIAMGRLTDVRAVEIVPCREVIIRGDETIAAQIDGEPIEDRTLTVSLTQSSVQIIVPDRFLKNTQGSRAA